MQIKSIIEKKRDGKKNTVDELSFLVSRALTGEVSHAQVSAWLMAVYFNGMSSKEVSALTRLMWKSGKTVARESRDDFWVDKHSTGGVGDKTSLLLVPLVIAAAERVLGAGKVRIPMISGRGLGHTGGTLDKLESVRGFQTALELQDAQRLMAASGFFMIGQTDDFTPADRLFYSLRDSTATVESIPLIVSSIMSKKLSENLDGLVIDLKVGVGAFMRDVEHARQLASGLIEVAQASALQAEAVLTSMESPLGRSVGHLIEVEECYDFLVGKNIDPGLYQVTMELASRMLKMADRSASLDLPGATKAIESVLNNGEALNIFEKMFEQQGGDLDVWKADCRRYREELKTFEFRAQKTGFVQSIHSRRVGVLVGELGGGRLLPESKIDPRVGAEVLAPVGQSVNAGEVVMRCYYPSSQGEEIFESYSDIFVISDEPVATEERILEIIK